MTTAMPHSVAAPTVPANNALRRTAIITAIPNPGQVTINLGGDTTATVDATCVREYMPVIGDSVLVISNGADHCVAGALNNDVIGGVPAGLQGPGGILVAHRSGTQALADVTWVETGVSQIDYGSNITGRTITLDGSGHMIIPATGLYIIQVSALMPGVGWIAFRAGVDVAGLGGSGPSNRSIRNIATATTGATAPWVHSEPIPLPWNQGDVIAPYLLQSSGGSRTVAAGNIFMTGYRVG